VGETGNGATTFRIGKYDRDSVSQGRHSLNRANRWAGGRNPFEIRMGRGLQGAIIFCFALAVIAQPRRELGGRKEVVGELLGVLRSAKY